MDFLHIYLRDVGFSDREKDVYLAVLDLGIQPASVVAKHLGFGRTTVYKILMRFVERGIVSMSQRHGVKQFFVSDAATLRGYVHREKQRFGRLEDSFFQIESDLRSRLPSSGQVLPKIRLYEGLNGVAQFYLDLSDIIMEQELLTIKYFSSNTFSQSVNGGQMPSYASDFFADMVRQGVRVEGYLGNGLMIMESLSYVANLDLGDFQDLPAGNSSVHFFVAGNQVCIVIFKSTPFGIRIESEDLAQVMHFLFEKLEVE